MAKDKAKEKIVIVLHDLRGGGAERMMARLASALAAQGKQVTMVLMTQGGVSKSELSEAVNLVELGAPRTLSGVGRLSDFLKQYQPDTILAALTHVNVACAIAAFLAGMLNRLVVSERNTFSMDKKVNRSPVMRLTYWLAPKIYKRLSNPVIAVSKGVAKDLIESEGLRSKDVVIAPNPVLTASVLAKMSEKPAHAWLKQSDSQFDVIVAVGRLSQQKGFDTLLRATAIVREKRDIRLVVFGEGELRDQLQDLREQLNLNDVVDLPGYSANPLAEMKAASLFVLSSRFEGSPNVLVEAMASGVPVVATDCPSGPYDILDGGRLAPLVPVDDVQALAEGMLEALEKEADPALQKKADDYRDFVSAKVYSCIFEGALQVSTG